MQAVLLVFTFFLLSPCIRSAYTAPSKSLEFTVGPNLIVNPNLTTPVIAPMCYFDQMYYLAGWTTKVQIVEYIDTYLLQLQAKGDACTNFKGTTQGQQFLDVDSYYINEQYYQRFTLTAGRYFRLSFDWISENSFPLSSVGIAVVWNSAIISTFYDVSCTLSSSTYFLPPSIAGSNQIMFQGMGTPDCAGILIRNIQLQQMFYIQKWYSFWNVSSAISSPQFITLFAAFYQVHNNPLGRYISLFSAVKQNVRFLCGLWLQLNHLVLYNYHQLNTTLTATIILAGMKAFDDERGYILDTYIFPLLGTSPEKIVARFELNISLPVIMNRTVQIYITRPASAILQILNILLVDVPVTLIFCLVGAIVFRLCFKYRLSLLFRQYSVPVFMIYLVLDGRIQILTFHVLSRFLMLANRDFFQKIATIGVIVAYFLVFLCAFGLMALYRSSIYKRFIGCVGENCRYASTGTLYMTVHFGIFNISLGFAHRLLLSLPFLQLCALIAIQSACLVYLLVFLVKCRYKSTILGGIMCCLNCSRLLFAVSLLLFQILPNQKQNILNTIQLVIFYSFLGLVSLYSAISLINKGKFLWKAFNSSSNRYCKDLGEGKKIRIEMDVQQAWSRKELIKEKRQKGESKRSQIYEDQSLQPTKPSNNIVKQSNSLKRRAKLSGPPLSSKR